MASLLGKCKRPAVCLEGVWGWCAGKGDVKRVGSRNPSAQSVDEVKETVPAEALGEHRTSASRKHPRSLPTFGSLLYPLLGHPSSCVHWPRLGRHAGVEHGPLLP